MFDNNKKWFAIFVFYTKLNATFKNFNLRNSNLYQTRQSDVTMDNLRRELDHATENAESNNTQHQEEIEKLKQLLRTKDLVSRCLSESLSVINF